MKRQKDLGMLALTLVGSAVPTSTERDYARLQQRLLPHTQTCTARIFVPQAVTVQSSGLDSHFKDRVSQQKDILIMLGVFYINLGKLDEAEKMLLRALQGHEETLGAKHTSTLNTVNSLGKLYREQGKLAEAEKCVNELCKGVKKHWDRSIPRHLRL